MYGMVTLWRLNLFCYVVVDSSHKMPVLIKELNCIMHVLWHLYTAPGISASPSEDNMRYFNVMILGPAQSPYEGSYKNSNVSFVDCIIGFPPPTIILCWHFWIWNPSLVLWIIIFFYCLFLCEWSLHKGHPYNW